MVGVLPTEHRDRLLQRKAATVLPENPYRHRSETATLFDQVDLGMSSTQTVQKTTSNPKVRFVSK